MGGRSWVSQIWKLRLRLDELDWGGAELAAGLRDAGAVGAVPLAAGPIAVGPIAAAGVEPAARRGAVDGVVVVPTGPLLLLGLDAVVMRQSPPVAFVVASGASGDDVETCNLPMNLQFVDGGSDAVLLWEIV